MRHQSLAQPTKVVSLPHSPYPRGPSTYGHFRWRVSGLSASVASSRKSIRAFVVIATDANELVAQIHNRMPLIIAPKDYVRWLSEEPDPRELMLPFPAAPMRMWSISTRVNKPENDDPAILEPVKLASSAA
jgi:putative SOS response-associated peptidase YedK